MSTKFIVRIPYGGSTPGADTNEYTLFDTTVAFPGANFCAMWDLGRFVMSLVNNQAGTLNLYRYTSSRLAAARTKIYTAAVSASAASSNNPFDLRVGEYSDFAVTWTNGGSAQTTWLVDMALYPLGVTVT